jgi:hypothetical protein
MLEYINKFRSTNQVGDVLMLNDPKKGLFRRSMFAKFPFMAKLWKLKYKIIKKERKNT